MKIFTLFFSCFLLISNQLQAQFSAIDYSTLWVGFSQGDFITIDRDYVEVGLFNPICIDKCSIGFLDVRGYIFDKDDCGRDCCGHQGRWGSSVGVGYRRSFGKCGIIGLNGYYDHLDFKHHHAFNRLGLGAEWLHFCCCWDARINAYIPVGNKRKNNFFCVFDNIEGGFFATERSFDFVYHGVDAEIGRPLFCWLGGWLYGAIGPYRYWARHARHFWGGAGCLELIWRYAALRYRTSYDHVFRWRH